MLTQGERKRYDRQIMIKEIGEEGQEKLKGAKIFLAGAGGLGSQYILRPRASAL
jgi:molybdopterin/thiamine biosynthesis adenylyltransferase